MWVCTIKLSYTQEDKVTGGICRLRLFSWINRQEADRRFRDGDTFRGPASFLMHSIKRSAVRPRCTGFILVASRCPVAKQFPPMETFSPLFLLETLTYTPVSSFNKFIGSSRWTSLFSIFTFICCGLYIWDEQMHVSISPGKVSHSVSPDKPPLGFSSQCWIVKVRSG